MKTLCKALFVLLGLGLNVALAQESKTKKIEPNATLAQSSTQDEDDPRLKGLDP